MSLDVLDLTHNGAKGATAILVRKKSKRLGIRLSFRIDNAPPILAIASVGRGKQHNMIPNLLVVEYERDDDKVWKITLLRTYGHKEGALDEAVVNIHPHDNLKDKRVPAWIRDSVIEAMPE